ncbi:MAG: ribonuclease III [Clostridiales Family XIII bacterium]|nr:ribonuclease III [Clostridiales Family XIII bacterium]
MNEKKLQERIGYEFKDASLLYLALNHTSYVNERGMLKFSSNERLEFLGDAVLEGLISDVLYRRLPDREEGVLTRLRSHIVCENSLFRCANKLSLGEFLNLGRGEEATGGRRKPSVVADAMEALIGAIYLDGGRDAAEQFVMDIFSPIIDEAAAGDAGTDYKSRLQEALQAEGSAFIQYKVENETGPDHDKIFYVSVLNGNKPIGKGAGKNKKQAEQSAAKNALEDR